MIVCRCSGRAVVASTNGVCPAFCIPFLGKYLSAARTLGTTLICGLGVLGLCIGGCMEDVDVDL